MQYIFIDSCSFIRFISQGRPGCEPVQFDALLKLLDGKSHCLLLPEVAEMEVAKAWDAFGDHVEEVLGELAAKFDAFDKQLPHKAKWSETDDVMLNLKQRLHELKASKLQLAIANHASVLELFKHKSTIRIPFTIEVWFAAKRRLVAGKMPPAEKHQDNDASIIESLRSFFTENKPKKPVLLICTENDKDFLLKVKDTWTLHPCLHEGLPPAQCFVNLKQLVEFTTKNLKVVEPKSEDVEQALSEAKMKRLQEQLAISAKRLRDAMRRLLGEMTLERKLDRLLVESILKSNSDAIQAFVPDEPSQPAGTLEPPPAQPTGKIEPPPATEAKRSDHERNENH
jgi:hypothetical protein